jgi:hypothetical protein
MQRLRFTTLDRFRMILDRQINANVVVLAGAGVSMIPPTVLPSGDSLRDECVRHLLSDGTSRRVIRRLLRTPAYRPLLPEAKAQILQGRLSKAATTLARLVAEARLTPDPYICNDSISGCLAASRDTRRLILRIQTEAAVAQPDRWWRRLLHSHRATKPVGRILSNLNELRILHTPLRRP